MHINLYLIQNNNVRLNKLGGIIMSNNKKVMSDNLKYEIAHELGVLNTVEKEGWGSVSSKNCGNLVKKAIEKANQLYQ
jgi:small acid-soluble spore protein F (minor alpha/beta-type SASP)